MLILHITIALVSVGFATFLYFSPTIAKLYASYGLVALTLLSGTYLVISTGSPILKSCLTGLVYTLAMTVVIALARNKIVAEKVRDK